MVWLLTSAGLTGTCVSGLQCHETTISDLHDTTYGLLDAWSFTAGGACFELVVLKDSN